MLLIHLSINAHIGCLYILAIVDSATVNMGENCSFLIVNKNLRYSHIPIQICSLFSIFTATLLFRPFVFLSRRVKKFHKS